MFCKCDSVKSSLTTHVVNYNGAIIRPVSDLRNKFTEIENVVKEGEPVYPTKNGYGSMVVMSIEQYAQLTLF